MTSIRSVLLQAQAQLNSAHQLDAIDARYESLLLLQHALKVDRAWLIAHDNDDIDADVEHQFNRLIQRLIGGEPIAYILGNREFYGLNLAVTPDTLIPRPDTETLVEAALAKIPVHETTQTPSFRRMSESCDFSKNNHQTLDSDLRRNDEVSVLDLGTGSGAIALAIAKSRPQTNVVAVDASTAALEVAKKNASNLQITNVRFLLSNWFSALAGERFDIIVSNPPYIETADSHLKQGDLRFEPISALASGADGLEDIRRIIDDCLIHLKPQGWLMFEHGYNQAESVRDLMAQTGLVAIETLKDLGGNDRVTIGKNPLIVSTHWD
jgi:release factor glutamine methyltransferase